MIVVLKMIFNFAHKRASNCAASLFDLEEGCTAILSDIDLPEHVADQLMNLGFIPGLEVKVTRSGPGGDPRIYRVDGTEIALRRELAEQMHVTNRPSGQSAEPGVVQRPDRLASPVETRKYAGPEGVSALIPTIEEAGD
jgi:Fe2+ transport system protein FeoA